MKDQSLRRSLSIMQVIALSSGAVIGGWLAEAPYWFSLTGSSSALLFPILAVLLIPVGLAFSELTAMLPFSSSVDVWTCNAFGHTAGFFTQWLMFLIQVVEPPLMAFIFITAFKFFVPIPAAAEMWVAIAIMVIWFILSNFQISLTGKLANVLFYCMIFISLAVAIAFFTSGNWSMENVTANGGIAPQGGRGIFVAMAVFSLKFIGFEMTPTMIEETNFPAKKIWIVVLCALLIPAVLYFIVVLAMSGMMPWDVIAGMGMPEPEIVQHYGMWKVIGIAAILAGVMHAFTTIMSFWTASSRVLYGAAQLNQIPHVFKRLNRHGQPFVANVVVLLFAVFFCLFTGENWVQYIYAISCVAAGAVYLITCINAIVLRKKHPDWERPFKAPGGTPVLLIGCVVSVWIMVGSCLELPVGGYVSMALFMALGAILFLAMGAYRKKNPGKFEYITLTPADIGKVTGEAAES